MGRQANWVVRLYDPSDYDRTISYVYMRDRTEDNLISFEGMYGLDDYLVWEMTNDLAYNDFSTVALDVRFSLQETYTAKYVDKQYRPVEISYNPNTSRYILYAITETSAILSTDILSYKPKNLVIEKTRPGHGVLEEILQGNEILNVRYDETVSRLFKEFEYEDFVIQYDWSVSDLINAIAIPNRMEWFARDGTVYIGREILAHGKKNSATFDKTGTTKSESPFCLKYAGPPRSHSVKSYLEAYRCIWAKHWAGKCGGVTKSCFSKIGKGPILRDEYFQYLEHGREKYNALRLFAKDYKIPQVSIGTIIEDTGKDEYVDSVSVQKNSKIFNIRNPRQIIFDTKTDKHSPKYVENGVSRSTPYLEENGGILFPSVDVSSNKAPNSVLFKLDGMNGNTVLGPYVFGNGRDPALNYPTKRDKKDFKFMLPCGWCLYVDGETGETIIQISDSEVHGAPLGTGSYLKFSKTGLEIH